MSPRLPPARRGAIRRRLIDWYRASKRDLPWRRTDDPYRIWLSETMLQQTRVETVLHYYERFLQRFPSLEALASADEQDVLKQWEGLGYYSRARNLKRAAEMVVRDHAGALPRDAEALGALPGVGRYTSGAIRSIAFKEAAPIVDGNVKRVLSRLTAEPSLSERDLWALAEALVCTESPDLLNQALMELGATVCVPRNPLCLVCPVRGQCAAAAKGQPERFPAPKPRKPPRPVRALGGVLRSRRGDRVLVLRRPSRGLLGGLWEIPSVAGDSLEELLESIHSRARLRVRARDTLGEVRHGFSHRALTLRVVALEHLGGRLRPGVDESARWCTEAQLGELPLSRLMQKVLELAERAE